MSPEKEKVTLMILNVDLKCSCCYKKVRKLLCKFPQIREQVFDEEKNKVMIKVVCCDPEKLRDMLCCKGGNAIQSIEIPKPQKPPSSPPPPTTTTTTTILHHHHHHHHHHHLFLFQCVANSAAKVEAEARVTIGHDHPHTSMIKSMNQFQCVANSATKVEAEARVTMISHHQVHTDPPVM